MDPTADDKAAEGDKASTTKSADISTNAGTSAATTNDEATDGGKAEGRLCRADWLQLCSMWNFEASLLM